MKKKLIVVAHPRPARDRVPHDEAEPSRARLRSELSAVSRGRSSTSTRPIWNAEKRNVAASTRTATGALKSCTRAPPTAGPATNDTERDALSFEFASR